jgi:hypothetical protein
MLDVSLRLLVGPHPVVHRGDDEHRTRGSEKAGCEQIVGVSVGNAGHEVGGGGRQDDEVGLAREADVVQGVTGAEQLRVRASSGDRFEGDRADEFLRRGRENNVNSSLSLSDEPRQPDGFVAGDPSRYAK